MSALAGVYRLCALQLASGLGIPPFGFWGQPHPFLTDLLALDSVTLLSPTGNVSHLEVPVRCSPLVPVPVLEPRRGRRQETFEFSSRVDKRGVSLHHSPSCSSARPPHGRLASSSISPSPPPRTLSLSCSTLCTVLVLAGTFSFLSWGTNLQRFVLMVQEA